MGLVLPSKLLIGALRQAADRLAHNMRPIAVAMNPKTFLVLALVATAVACGRNSSVQRSQQQQYDVVQEGSANGVTSTINAPGETAAPTTSSTITDTNVDTTTNFTLPNTATTTSTEQPGTVASTLLQNESGTMPSGYYPPRTRPRPKPIAPPATTTTEEQPTTDTTAPPPPTDTTGTQGR